MLANDMPRPRKTTAYSSFLAPGRRHIGDEQPEPSLDDDDWRQLIRLPGAIAVSALSARGGLTDGGLEKLRARLRAPTKGASDDPNPLVRRVTQAYATEGTTLSASELGPEVEADALKLSNRISHLLDSKVRLHHAQDFKRWSLEVGLAAALATRSTLRERAVFPRITSHDERLARELRLELATSRTRLRPLHVRKAATAHTRPLRVFMGIYGLLAAGVGAKDAISAFESRSRLLGLVIAIAGAAVFAGAARPWNTRLGFSLGSIGGVLGVAMAIALFTASTSYDNQSPLVLAFVSAFVLSAICIFIFWDWRRDSGGRFRSASGALLAILPATVLISTASNLVPNSPGVPPLSLSAQITPAPGGSPGSFLVRVDLENTGDEEVVVIDSLYRAALARSTPDGTPKKDDLPVSITRAVDEPGDPILDQKSGRYLQDKTVAVVEAGRLVAPFSRIAPGGHAEASFIIQTPQLAHGVLRVNAVAYIARADRAREERPLTPSPACRDANGWLEVVFRAPLEDTSVLRRIVRGQFEAHSIWFIDRDDAASRRILPYLIVTIEPRDRFQAYLRHERDASLFSLAVASVDTEIAIPQAATDIQQLPALKSGPAQKAPPC